MALHLWLAMIPGISLTAYAGDAEQVETLQLGKHHNNYQKAASFSGDRISITVLDTWVLGSRIGGYDFGWNFDGDYDDYALLSGLYGETTRS